MASPLSGLFSSSSSFKLEKSLPKPPLATQSGLFSSSSSFKLLDRRCVQSVAREMPSSLSKAKTESPDEINKKGLTKDPIELWQRFVDWLYQHKELGLYLDVSRVEFTDEFVAEMEPRFQSAFRAIEELDRESG